MQLILEFVRYGRRYFVPLFKNCANRKKAWREVVPVIRDHIIQGARAAVNENLQKPIGPYEGMPAKIVAVHKICPSTENVRMVLDLSTNKIDMHSFRRRQFLRLNANGSERVFNWLISWARSLGQIVM